MRIEVHFSDRFYGVFERIARAVESIDRTLKTPDDFTSEDKTVKDATRNVMSATHAVHDAQERIPN